MSDKENNESGKQNFKVKIPEDVEQGSYSNVASVHINKNECIIDFGYRIPHPQEKLIKITNRINMSHQSAEAFLKAFSNAILDFKNSNKDQ